MDIFAPLRALASGEHRSLQVWTALLVAFVAWVWVWPAVSAWRARRSEKRAADHAEEIRVARLKQADAMRAALHMRGDVVEKQAPKREEKSERPLPAPVTFMQPAPRFERRPPRFGRVNNPSCGPSS
jgi:hypothetical protein